MQQLREAAALALLRLERVRGEFAVLPRQRGDRRVAPGQHRGQQRRGEAGPRQVGGLADHPRRRIALSGRRMHDREQQVRDDGGRRPARRDARAQLGRREERQHEERDAGLGERSARGVGERHDRGEVDERLGPIERRRDTGTPRARRRAQDQDRDRPCRERPDEDRERDALVRGMVDQLLGEEDDRDERRSHGGQLQRADARAVHSSNPRRIASATAAARSETPSFSYRRA